MARTRRSVAIGILHHRHESPWLGELLNSIDARYPVVISNHDGWAMDGVRHLFQTSRFEEIAILNESMIVKDNSVWDIIFEEHRGRSVMLADRYLMFCGKFLRRYLPPYPTVTNKYEDVIYGEGVWCQLYQRADPNYVPLQPLVDQYEIFEEKHGRTNMIVENDYFKKWKGHWDVTML